MADSATTQPFPLPSAFPELEPNGTTIMPFPAPTEPFPMPSVFPELAPNGTTIMPFPTPVNESLLSATVNGIATTLSSTTVSRAARSTFSAALNTTSAFMGRQNNSTDEIEWLLGGVDLDDYSFNSTFNSTNGNSTISASQNFFEQRPWLMWVLIGVGVLLLLGVALLLLIWFFCNKKKNSQPERTPLASTASSDSPWKKWLPCCATCLEKQTRNVADSRPLNDANLNPYKRPPLPPIGASQSILAGELDGYQGGHLPPHRLDPIKRHSNFDHFGANIQGLKGVPVIHVRKEDMRPLPQLA